MVLFKNVRKKQRDDQIGTAGDRVVKNTDPRSNDGGELNASSISCPRCSRIRLRDKDEGYRIIGVGARASWRDLVWFLS